MYPPQPSKIQRIRNLERKAEQQANEIFVLKQQVAALCRHQAIKLVEVAGGKERWQTVPEDFLV